MAEKIRQKKTKIPETAQGVIRALNIPIESVKIKTYDHCQTKEEIELEILSDYMRRGLNKKLSKDAARQEATFLWKGRLKG